VFRRILIANRGEIACRIARTCRALGVYTVAVFSDADRDAPHVRLCDEAVRLGGPAPADSYLRADLVLAAARDRGAEAIHPGYGFLSERASFAEACALAGIVFVGPSPDAIRRMGDKAAARRTAREAGVPVIPGSDGTLRDDADSRVQAASVGYPVMVKASAGGGGIGMQIARDEAELARALRTCSDRAKAAFGDGAVYLEKLFEAPRHVEVQVFGDGARVFHLFERECSLQRRHQKVLEETPSPLVLADASLGPRLYDSAVRTAEAVSYTGAGTVELLVADGAVHFLEMNTRLQVEHPVTELTTGLDLVAMQLRAASGDPVGVGDVGRQGHAIELRIYAEDPAKGYAPSPGTLTTFDIDMEGVRLDAGYEAGGAVTPYYDPLIGKLCVYDRTREACVDRALAALDRLHLAGTKPNGQPMAFNTGLHRRILQSADFRAGRVDTGFLARLK